MRWQRSGVNVVALILHIQSIIPLYSYMMSKRATHIFFNTLSFKSFLVRKEKEVSESVSADAVSELLIWFMKSEMMPVSVGKSSKHVYSYTKIKISSQTTITFVCCNSTGYFHRINLIFSFFLDLIVHSYPSASAVIPGNNSGGGWKIFSCRAGSPDFLLK